VSTEEQASSGAGIEAQRTAILAEAERRGWREADIQFIEDLGYSGKNANRPGLQLALEALRRGEAKALVVGKMDRLSRSLLDFVQIMATAQKQGWSLIALDAPVDPSTPAGEALVSVLATFSQLERRLIGQRTKDALAVKKHEGVRLGRPTALPDAVRERIKRERAKKKTLAAIAQSLNDDGVPTAQGGRRWYPSTVSAVLASARSSVVSSSSSARDS
jgi:DNA invertase Pin-like site-specific DNA recombinase